MNQPWIKKKKKKELVFKTLFSSFESPLVLSEVYNRSLRDLKHNTGSLGAGYLLKPNTQNKDET